MFSYSSSSNPAVRSHMDSQLAYFNDLNQALAGSFQAVCDANMKLGQTMIEETISAGQRMLSSERAVDAMGAAAAGAQPATDKLRAYQQHLSRLAAEVQVELARVNQQHGSETARTAHALVDEVTRVAGEETARSRLQQEDLLKKFQDPFQPTDMQRGEERAAKGTAGDAERASTSKASSAQGNGIVENGSVHSHVQASSAQGGIDKSARKPG